MEDILQKYMVRTAPFAEHIDEETGHTIASMLIAFTNEFYQKAVEQGVRALGMVRANAAAAGPVEKAIGIILDRAAELAPSSTGLPSEFTFEGVGRGEGKTLTLEEAMRDITLGDEESAYLAVPNYEEFSDIRRALDRDNALFLLYAVATMASPTDSGPLEEQLAHILLSKWDTYKMLLSEKESGQ
ncbi:MAG: hypothetical protein RQ758_03155 [Methanomicrobiaceae archaeon]|nr:hypothetical protein [Methanomicrobiaceae archaeon]